MAIGTTKELKDAYNELLEYEDECIKLKSIQDGQFSIQTVRSSEDVNPLNVTVLMKPDDSKKDCFGSLFLWDTGTATARIPIR